MTAAQVSLAREADLAVAIVKQKAISSIRRYLGDMSARGISTPPHRLSHKLFPTKLLSRSRQGLLVPLFRSHWAVHWLCCEEQLARRLQDRGLYSHDQP